MNRDDHNNSDSDTINKNGNVNKNGETYYRTGVSNGSDSGDSWLQVAGEKLSHIDSNHFGVFGEVHMCPLPHVFTLAIATHSLTCLFHSCQQRWRDLRAEVEER